MAYEHNGFRDGHAQNSNANVHATRRACRSLCKIADETANSNIIWNYSIIFLKIMYYDILQKYPTIFFRIDIYIKQTDGRKDGRTDG
jgi:hypothetical protein